MLQSGSHQYNEPLTSLDQATPDFSAGYIENIWRIPGTQKCIARNKCGRESGYLRPFRIWKIHLDPLH